MSLLVLVCLYHKLCEILYDFALSFCILSIVYNCTTV